MFQVARPLSDNAWIACAPDGAVGRFALVERARNGEKPAVRWLHEQPWSDVVHALKRARRTGRLRQHRCVALLERSQYQMLPMDAPDVPRDEWRSAVRWQLKDVVDFSVDAACIDLLEVPPQASMRRQQTLIAVAAPEAPLRALVAAAEVAGVRLHALDVPETALRNLSALQASPGRSHALLHVGPTHGTLVITLDGELLLSRQIDVNEAQIAEPDIACRQATFDRAGLELQRTLDGFERVFTGTSLERLQVLPGLGVSEFGDHVRELVYVPVSVVDPTATLDFTGLDSPVSLESLSPFLMAIGAALRP